MALKQVGYCSSVKLSCIECLPSNIVLCLQDNSLLAPFVCDPESSGSQPFNLSYIEASLVTFSKYNAACGGNTFKYVFEYDDSFLVNVDEPIASDDIIGVFCKGCLPTWVEEKVGDEPYIRNNEDGSVTFVSPHGCEYDFDVLGFQGFSVLVYGAVGDNATDDTAAIQATIDAASNTGTNSDGDGAQVIFPPGIYRHTGITVPSNVSLLGAGVVATVLRYTPVVGNAITLANTPAANSRYNNIFGFKIDCLTSTSGIAITSSVPPLTARDLFVDRYEIDGYFRGIYIPYSTVSIRIGAGRIIGQGSGVAGGVGIQLGDISLIPARFVDRADFQGCYVSDFATSFISQGFVHTMTEVTSINSDRAILCTGKLTVVGSWIQANTTLYQTGPSSADITSINNNHLNGASVEVDDPSTMSILNSTTDLAVFGRSEFKGAGRFRMRFATSALRGFQIGPTGTESVLYNSAGTARFEATARPIESNRVAAAASLIMYAIRRSGVLIGGLGSDSSDRSALFNATPDICAFWDNSRNFAAGAGLLLTTATNGFIYLPTCAGVPTGVPTAIAGYVPIVIDTSNFRIQIFTGGAWRDAQL